MKKLPETKRCEIPGLIYGTAVFIQDQLAGITYIVPEGGYYWFAANRNHGPAITELAAINAVKRGMDVMNLFDPQRPKLPVSERLQYTFSGHPVAAIPVLDVEPEPDGSFIISAMLKVDANSFVWHHARVPNVRRSCRFLQHLGT